MKSNRKSVWIALAAFIPFCYWLFKPLESGKFAIHFDENQFTKTKAFLTEDSPINDSIPRPNIIIILADDLGQTDISLYGNTSIQTPNIDNIGKKGITFSEGYTSSPICSPSRAALLTGRNQQRFGFEFQPHDIYLKNRMQYYGFKYFVDSAPWSPVWMTKVPRKKDRARQGLPPTEITLAELLKKQGYATAFIGKWHLGYADFALPCNRGFDYSYGFYNSHSLFAPEDAPGIVNQHVEEDWTDDYIWSSQRNGLSAIYRNCEMVKDSGYFTQRIAEEAIQFMEKNQDQPFLLYLPFNAPHTPLQAPQNYYDQYSHIEDPIKRIYNAMIASLDDAVGTVVDKVEQLGLTENTIFFFLSDNGGATYTLTTDNAPFKGGKITNFEGGIRVPFMVRWEGNIPSGKTFPHPVSAVDIFTTAAAAARAKLPIDRVFDGIDLLPYLMDSTFQAPHDKLCWQMGIAKAIRQGEWKLLLNDLQKDTILYHIATDPYETQNKKDQYPDIVQTLIASHHEWSVQMPPPLWPGMIYFEHKDVSGSYFFED